MAATTCSLALLPTATGGARVLSLASALASAQASALSGSALSGLSWPADAAPTERLQAGGDGSFGTDPPNLVTRARAYSSFHRPGGRIFAKVASAFCTDIWCRTTRAMVTR